MNMPNQKYLGIFLLLSFFLATWFRKRKIEVILKAQKLLYISDQRKMDLIALVFATLMLPKSIKKNSQSWFELGKAANMDKLFHLIFCSEWLSCACKLFITTQNK